MSAVSTDLHRAMVRDGWTGPDARYPGHAVYVRSVVRVSDRIYRCISCDHPNLSRPAVCPVANALSSNLPVYVVEWPDGRVTVL